MLNFFGFISVLLFLHPIHISVMNIDFDDKNQALEITQKVFIDDLEAVLEARHNVKLRLGSDREHPRADAFIEAYLDEHLWLQTVEGRKLEGEFLGKESDLEYIWVYIEVTQVRNLQSLTVQNTILMDWFDDQSNIVRLRYRNQSPTVRLTPAKQRGTFQLAP